MTTRTWNGSNNTNFTNGANWIGGVAPGAADDAVIPGGTVRAPSLGSNTSISSLSFTGGNTLTMTGGATVLTVTGVVPGTTFGVNLAGTDTITGVGTINAANGINVASGGVGTITANAGTLTVTGVLSESGTGTLALSMAGNNDIFALTSAGSSVTSVTFAVTNQTETLQLGANATLTVSNQVTLSGDKDSITLGGANSALTDLAGISFTAKGTISGAGTVTGAVSAGSNAAQVRASGGTLVMASAVTGTGLLLSDAAATDTLQFNAGGNTAQSVTLNGGTLKLNAAATTLTVTNAMAVGAGTVNLAVAGAALTDNAGYTISTGTITGAGTVNGTVAAAGGAGHITASGGTLVMAGQVTGTALALSDAAATDTLQLNAAGNTAQSVTLNGGTLELNAAATTLTVTNAMAVGAGTVSLAAAGAMLTDTNGLITLANGSITGLGSIAANTNISGFGIIAIPISTAGSITASGGLLDVQKTVTGRTLTITGSNDTLQLDAAGTSTASLAINGGTLKLGSAIAALTDTNSTALAIGTGTVNLAVAGAALTDNAGYTISTGTITGAGTVTGAITASGAATIAANGGLLDIASKITDSANALTLKITGNSDTLRLDAAGSAAHAVNFNNASGTLELNTAGTLTVNAALAVGTGTVKLDAAGTVVQLTDASGVSLSGGTLSGTGLISTSTHVTGFGNVGISVVGRTVTTSGGTLDVTGAMSTTSALSIADVSGSVLKIDNSGVTINPVAVDTSHKTLEIAKSATINGTSAQAITGTLTVDAGATLTMSGALTNNAGGNINISGTLSDSAQISNAGTITLTGGTLTDASGLTNSSGAHLTGSGTVNSAISGTGGTITASNGVLNLNGTVASGQSFAIDTASLSTLMFSNTATSSAPIAITSSNQTLEIGSGGNLTINGAESVTNGTIRLDDGTLALNDSSGTNFALTVGSLGTLTGSGAAPNEIILAGGTVSQSGVGGQALTTVSITGSGTVNGVTGAAEIAASGTLDLTGTVSGAQLVVDVTTKPGASVLQVDGNVTAGDTGSIALTDANQTVEIGANGTLTLLSSETVSNGTIKLDGGTLNATGGLNGTLDVNPITKVPGIGVTLIGKGVVNGAISGRGVVEGEGGLLTVSNNVTSSTILLEVDSAAASVLELGGTITSSTSFTYLNTGGTFSGTLQVDAGALGSFGSSGVIISGMHVATGAGVVPTDILDMRSVGFSSINSTDISNGNMIQVWGDAAHTDLLASFHLAASVAAGSQVDWQSDASGGTNLFLDDDPCYVAGTHILTATGERTVESLMQGDIVLTLAGGGLSARPVKWIGTRRIDLTAHPRPETAAPIRIRRGAFADNMPHRDLLVSPDHAVFVDGKLICARQLVNGATICVEKGRAAVEYFHVELDSHAILLAEGLPAESYLNTGNHGFFINSGEPLVLHPDMTDESDYPTREAGSCAPFVSDEASVLPVWLRLAERAAALGQPAPRLATTDDPELRIVAKGRTVRPLYGENGLYIFALPKGTTEARVVSRSGAPTDARPWLDDRRCLGVNVERIVLRGASELREVPVDHPGLVRGWHAVERDGVALRRWTSGDAVLPLPAMAAPTMLEIRASSGGMAYLADAEQEQRAA